MKLVFTALATADLVSATQFYTDQDKSPASESVFS